MKKTLLIIGIISLLAALGVAAVIIYMGLSTRTNNHSQRYSDTDWQITQIGTASCVQPVVTHPVSIHHNDGEITKNFAANIAVEPLFPSPPPQAFLENFPAAAAQASFGKHRGLPLAM